MKKTLLIFAALAAALSLFVSSCSKDDSIDDGLSAYEEQIKTAAEKYVPGVVYSTYGSLATAGKTLCDDIKAMKAKGVGSLTQADIDKACSDFLAARAYWEASEAFHTEGPQPPGQGRPEGQGAV